MVLKTRVGQDFPDITKITDPATAQAFRDLFKILQDSLKNSYDDLNGLSTAQTLYIGDSVTNGSWRLTIVGADLSVQTRIGGAWVERFSFSVT